MPNRRIGVRIRADQNKWLEEHPVINFSGLVVQIIEEQKRKQTPFRLVRGPKRREGHENRSIAKDLYIADVDKEWLDSIRSDHHKKSFLSIFVQRRLDHIIKTESIGSVDIVQNIENLIGQ